MNPQKAAELRQQLIAFATAKPAMAKARLPQLAAEKSAFAPAVVLPYKPVPVSNAPQATRSAIKAAMKTAMKTVMKTTVKAPMKAVRARQQVAAAR
jgi:hypothetical protein